MDQIKYQGYARDRGFNPIQMSTASIDAISQQGNYLLRQMQDNRETNRRNRDAYQAGMVNAQNIERQNRADNFAFEQRSRDRAQEALNQNLKQKVYDAQSYQQNLDKQVTALGALSGLAPTIGKMVLEYKKGRDEADELFGKNLVFQYGVTPKILQEYEANKSKINTAATAANGVANQLEFQGVPVEVLERVRGLSGKKLVGATTAFAINGGDNYPVFYAQNSNTPIPYNGGEITLATARNQEEWEAANTFIRTEFLKQYIGINDALLDEYLFPSMRKHETVVRAQFNTAIQKNISDNIQEDKLQSFENAVKASPGEGFINYIQSEAGYDPVTGKNREWLRAKRHEAFGFLAKLVETGEVTAAQVEAIKDFAYTHNDGSTKKLGLAFDREFAEIDKLVYQKQKTQFEQAEFADRQADQELEKLYRQKAETEGFTKAEVEKLQQNHIKQTGRESEFLKDVITSEKIQDDIARQELAYRRNRGLLTTKHLMQPGRYSEDVISEFRNAAAEGDNLASVSKERLNKELQFLYRRAQELRGDTSTDKRDSSAQAWAEIRIEDIYRQKVLQEMEKGNRAGALEAATTYVSNLLWEGKASKKGPFQLSDQIQSLNPYIGMGKANSFVAEVTRAGSIAQKIISTNGSYASSDVFLLPNELKQVKAFKRGAGTIPPIIFTIASKSPSIDPIDLINAQLTAAGDTPLAPTLSQQVRNSLSPLSQRILQYRPSTANTYQAFGANSATDPYRGLLDLIASKESQAHGQYDAMNRGGYSAHEPIGSANSKEVFGVGLSQMTVADVMQRQRQREVFAAGRYQIVPGTLASLMSGNYGFTGVNLQDRFDATTQDKLAVALIRGRAGKFFNRTGSVEEAVIGMGNEWSGLQKVSRKVLANRLEAARVALNSQSMWRQPENMRSNVVYRIGSLGYGSTGPHLDVKRVDRGTMQTTGSVPIATNELDNYVDVQVSGKWKPLSGGTQITDNEQRHRARNSYGIDYAANDGTPVRLKNGAQVVGSFKGDQGTDHLIIQLPDGRRFQFLHGTIA